MYHGTHQANCNPCRDQNSCSSKCGGISSLILLATKWYGAEVPDTRTALMDRHWRGPLQRHLRPTVGMLDRLLTGNELNSRPS